MSLTSHFGIVDMWHLHYWDALLSGQKNAIVMILTKICEDCSQFCQGAFLIAYSIIAFTVTTRFYNQQSRQKK